MFRVPLDTREPMQRRSGLAIRVRRVRLSAGAKPPRKLYCVAAVVSASGRHASKRTSSAACTADGAAVWEGELLDFAGIASP